MTSENSSDTVSIPMTTEDDSPGVSISDEEESVPEGATYPLNSKKLVVSLLRRLAAMLELPSQGTAATLRQLIEGKLVELEYEPRNIQVIVASADSKLYLVDESGILKQESEHVSPEDFQTHNNISHVTNDIESLQGELREARLEVEGLRERVRERDETLAALRVEIETANADLSEARVEIETLRREIKVQTAKAKRFWTQKCEQLLTHETVVEEKDAEIARLQELISNRARTTTAAAAETLSEDNVSLSETEVVFRGRRGKAPPVDPFKGSDPELRFEDWLPTLERAATWNGWSQNEKLMQLAGHLRGKAAREYSLLSSEEKRSFPTAVQALRVRLDPGSCALAAQEFRNALQRDKESVSDYITRLERSFQIAYGHERLTPETRDAFLFSQLQAGLKLMLMESPAVSGSLTYKQLCVAAKQEEKRLLELKRRRQHLERQVRYPAARHTPSSNDGSKSDSSTGKPPRECYICGKTDHLAKQCRQRKSESNPMEDKKHKKGKETTAITKTIISTSQRDTTDPLNFLSSDSDTDGSINLVRITDQGSHLRKVTVEIAGVPATGLVDTGADITIMGPDLFKKVAAVAGLKKRQFKPADKQPHTYDRRQFHLDGRLDLDVSFDDKTMHTSVYVKMDAYDDLLLSEGVCSQLGIVTYHAQVGGNQSNTTVDTSTSSARSVRISLVDSLRLAPRSSTLASVKLDTCGLTGPLLLEQTCHLAEDGYDGLEVGESLVNATSDGVVKVLICNPTGTTHTVSKGTYVGVASKADPVLCHTSTDSPPQEVPKVATSLMKEFQEDSVTTVYSVETVDLEARKQKLMQSVAEVGINLSQQDRNELYSSLCEYHDVFVLEEGERGETALVQMEIDTGDARPKRQPVRRTPFAARQEIARQLKQMQEQNVIYPSDSPWASPVVLVRKKDGSLRFCIDYRSLNLVTKSDPFPLPRIDDLLDQLGKAKYFSTLDLASGYWQVQLHPDSRAKSAFVTHQGLYEFRVMPFGLKNAPAVFQRLMQKVLTGLNPETGPDFVAIYLDDILVFSETFEAHLLHLRQVLERFKVAGLKLKPSKCHFFSQTVEYLGHLVTPREILPNPNRVSAIKEFPAPKSVKEVRQFLGLGSYYRRFIRNFAEIAHPLHLLTQKDAIFQWSPECQKAFQQLKDALVSPPVLAYPDFSKSFTLETDASIKGLGAVLSQLQDDNSLHPVAYASRSVSGAEKRYAITELETLAVVWAVSHFHAYLYGNDVNVYTDHSAVKAVLETPNPSAKHARWWTKVYGSGVRNIQIFYRPGKENMNADILSRTPADKAPDIFQSDEVQIAAIHTTQPATELDIRSLLSRHHSLTDSANSAPTNEFALSQQQDPELLKIIRFLTNDLLPDDKTDAKKIVAQAHSFAIVDGVLYFIDVKHNHQKRCVVPKQLRNQLMEETHTGPMAGHFAGEKLYRALTRHWWWSGMYTDVVKYCSNCPQCAIVNGSGRVNKPPLSPIPVQRPFQIIGVDVMDLPVTELGNRHVVVFQDFLTKWPLVFPVPDQKAVRLVKLLTEEVIPLFGVPEALLSDRGTNLMSHLMLDICKKLGIRKLNTTAYHPECDGMVERFNRTLKTAIRKHAATYGPQWDRYLSGILFAYRNIPHDSTGEKPSYLLFGVDCRTPTDAEFLNPTSLQLTDIQDYREELSLSLASARDIAAKAVQAAQKRYKRQYDKKVQPVTYRVGEWVLVKFPAEESGKMRKLSRPWHGPYRITKVNQCT